MTPRVLVTGAAGNIGTGSIVRLREVGFDVVASDLSFNAEQFPSSFVPLDVTRERGWQSALEGCDIVLHLPAWHGIHVAEHTEREFWSLNVEGTHQMLQAARIAGVKRVAWLSSQAWHGHYDKYGFTKRVGEELLRYHREAHGLSFVAIRPGSLTPPLDPHHDYGRNLLYGRVDREDVLDAVVSAVQWVERSNGGLVVDVLHPDSIPQEALDRWGSDPVEVADTVFPGAREVIEKHGLDVREVPKRPTRSGWSEIGYAPSRDFGTYVAAQLLADSPEPPANTQS